MKFDKDILPKWTSIVTWILGLLLFTIISCVGIPPTPEDSNKKSTPQCCKGQETHTCGMPGMPDKPEQERKVG